MRFLKFLPVFLVGVLGEKEPVNTPAPDLAPTPTPPPTLQCYACEYDVAAYSKLRKNNPNLAAQPPCFNPTSKNNQKAPNTCQVPLSNTKNAYCFESARYDVNNTLVSLTRGCGSNSNRNLIDLLSNGTAIGQESNISNVCKTEKDGQICGSTCAKNLCNGNQNPGESSGLSTGAIVGIVIGSVLAVALIAGLIYYFTAYKGYSQPTEQNDHEMNG